MQAAACSDAAMEVPTDMNVDSDAGGAMESDADADVRGH